MTLKSPSVAAAKQTEHQGKRLTQRLGYTAAATNGMEAPSERERRPAKPWRALLDSNQQPLA